MKIVELCNISKSFRQGKESKSVLNGINLTISQGEFVVLRGVNGSGKTTLLNIILGLLKPDNGEAKLLGISPQEPESKANVGVVLQKVTVPKNFKVKELVSLFRSYYPNSLSVDEILNKVNLEGKHDAWGYKLCGGEEQRLYFALALAGNPKLLILDEPTRNLDEEGCTNFWIQVKNCVQQGITISEQWLTMFFSLILGIIPFAIFGLALGYLVQPKIINSITALSIPVALFTCGLPLPVPKFVQDLISFSPFYHYGQLALWSTALDYDQYLWLHILWLVWFGFTFSFVALWAYRRDQVLQ
jgi:ABC-type Mn2+/Zn2+ transport system ATPase subunit